MIDVNSVILENGIEYIEVDELKYNNIRYVLLSNVNNVKDSCIRKIVLKNNEELLCGLENDNEFDVILELFYQKNRALFN